MLLYFQLKQQQKFLRRIATHRLLVVDKIWLLYLFEYALLIEDNLCEHLEWISMCWKHHWENVFLFIYFFAAFVPPHFFKNDLNTSTNACCLTFYIFGFPHVKFCHELWKFQNDFFWYFHDQFSECLQQIISSVHKRLHPSYFRFSGNLLDSIKSTKAVHPNNGVS